MPSTQESPVVNTGFGGDLLGFGQSTQPTVSQPVNQQHNLMGGDLMGFGFSSPTNPPVNPVNPPQPNLGGFNFNNNFNGGFGSQPTQPPQPPQNNSGGFNLLGNTSPSVPVVQPTQPSTISFQPIINNNPNKILAYDNAHLQIWMDCIK